MYYTFPAFARWALRRKNADVEAETPAPVERRAVEPDSATHSVPANPSKHGSSRETTENLSTAQQSGAVINRNTDH